MPCSLYRLSLPPPLHAHTPTAKTGAQAMSQHGFGTLLCTLHLLIWWICACNPACTPTRPHRWRALVQGDPLRNEPGAPGAVSLHCCAAHSCAPAVCLVSACKWSGCLHARCPSVGSTARTPLCRPLLNGVQDGAPALGNAMRCRVPTVVTSINIDAHTSVNVPILSLSYTSCM